MGTYLYYRQTDKSKIAATDKFLRAHKDEDNREIVGLWTKKDRDIELAKGERGSPDFMQIGEGCFKLSCAEGDEIVKITDALMAAKEKFGLTIDLPTNAPDYMTQAQIDRLVDPAAFKAKCKREKLENAGWKRAQEKALAKMRAEITSGLYLCRYWSPAPNDKIWVLFGNVEPEEPQFLQYEYKYKGETRKSIYTDAEGIAYLLISLLPLLNDGVKRVWHGLMHAWEIGLRTQPAVMMAACYRMLPKKIKINGRNYIPQQTDHWSCNSQEVLYVKDGKVVEDVCRFNETGTGFYGFIQDKMRSYTVNYPEIKLVPVSDPRTAGYVKYVATFQEFARIFEFVIEQERAKEEAETKKRLAQVGVSA